MATTRFHRFKLIRRLCNSLLIGSVALFSQVQATQSDILAQVDFQVEGANVEAMMEGMLVYYADAALFIECTTGKRFPVLMEERWGDVVQAYLNSDPADMAFRHVAADVRLTWQGPPKEPAEVDAERYYAVFIGDAEVSSGITCGNDTDFLLGRSWEAEKLPDIEREQLASLNAPWMQLRPAAADPASDEYSLGGNTACNAFGGTVSVDENDFEVLGLVATRLYCDDSMDIESAFLSATDQVVFSGLEGERWVWYDAEMVRLAEFQADSSLARGAGEDEG